MEICQDILVLFMHNFMFYKFFKQHPNAVNEKSIELWLIIAKAFYVNFKVLCLCLPLLISFSLRFL